MRRTSALIVGGGPAGAAAAITLARAGLHAVLVERGGKERIVCGGFLGWDALPALAGLGVDLEGLGARPIKRVRIVAGQRDVETRLPGPAAGLSRARLDHALLAVAEREGAEIIRGVAVRRVEDRRAFLADGSVLEAESLVLATGKHALRGAERAGAREDGHIGLRATIADPSPRLENAIELHLFAGGYAGLLVQEDGSANLCLSVAAARFRDAGGSVLGLADAMRADAPALARLIKEAGPAWSAIAGIPYGWRARHTETGRFRIGDQAGVIASLVGDGIAMALASGIAAAEALLAGGAAAAPAFQRALATRNAMPIRIAELVRGSAERPGLARAALPILGHAPGLIRMAANATRVTGPA
jgi:flavin-dependent dehydrogenase